MSIPAILANPSVADLDRRFWIVAAGIVGFGLLVMKEIGLSTPVLLVALIGLALAGRHRPEIPFYVLVAYLPFSHLLVENVGTRVSVLSLTNLLPLIVLGAYVMKRRAEGRPWLETAPLNTAVLL